MTTKTKKEIKNGYVIKRNGPISIEQHGEKIFVVRNQEKEQRLEVDLRNKTAFFHLSNGQVIDVHRLNMNGSRWDVSPFILAMRNVIAEFLNDDTAWVMRNLPHAKLFSSAGNNVERHQDPRFLFVLKESMKPAYEKMYFGGFTKNLHYFSELSDQGSLEKTLDVPNFYIKLCQSKDDALSLHRFGNLVSVWNHRYGKEAALSAIEWINRWKTDDRFGLNADEEERFIPRACGMLNELAQESEFDWKRLLEFIFEDAKWKQGIAPIDALQYLIDYRKMCKDMDWTPERYPKSIKTAHDLAMFHHKASIDDQKVRAWKMLLSSRDYQLMEDVGEDGDSEDENQRWIVKIPSAPEEITHEGKYLRHCVGSYIDRVLRGECKIVFLRKAGKPDLPYITMEIRDVNGKPEIVQAKGERNRSLTMTETRWSQKWLERYRERLSK